MMDEESMTEQDKREQSGLEQEPEQAKQPAPERASETVGEEPPVQSAEKQSASRLPLVLAVIALLAVLVGLLMGQRYWEGMQQSLFQVQAELKQTSQEQSRMSELLQQTAREYQSQQAQIESQQQALASQRQALLAQVEKMELERQLLQQRGQQLDSSLQEMRNRLGSNSNRWRVAEAEYLMRLANHRLSLSSDLKSAAAALQAADTRLRDTLDPGWNGVRDILAQEISTLQSTPLLDLSGLSSRINGLIEQVDGLRLLDEGGVVLRPKANAETLQPPMEDGRIDWRRLAEDLWQGFKSLMVIRHHQRPVTAMLPPEQRYFIYQNLRLKLEGAKLSLLSNSSELYQDSLQTAHQWVARHFDSHVAETGLFLKQLDLLAQQPVELKHPDISASLRALQGRRALLRDQQEAK
ncbi:uroporphyrinogen-III C-methyltransferase [endosymbiont of Ridgeia piscesae]|jgi:uroporphyrin-3 C-methyltransferase|uniref:Uroporphyrin-3 C-methyltransferase n=2 Tax=endosymbiont of Ridgeia piscesae TaxID=54398 RepID=A0A0T5Z5J6_9GAMM|nr:uroporphyrinogen-III C-methyltransferase [endosymbiont of Ridgeia piscesae]KRT57971.1 uroporphyrin-3 C-methyltransferase [endosymbiont of Ridgeia piscesae]